MVSQLTGQAFHQIMYVVSGAHGHGLLVVVNSLIQLIIPDFHSSNQD